MDEAVPPDRLHELSFSQADLRFAQGKSAFGARDGVCHRVAARTHRVPAEADQIHRNALHSISYEVPGLFWTFFGFFLEVVRRPLRTSADEMGQVGPVAQR